MGPLCFEVGNRSFDGDFRKLTFSPAHLVESIRCPDYCCIQRIQYFSLILGIEEYRMIHPDSFSSGVIPSLLLAALFDFEGFLKAKPQSIRYVTISDQFKSIHCTMYIYITYAAY